MPAAAAPKYRSKKREYLDKIIIDHVAAADFPAQEPALAVLIKARDGAPGALEKNGWEDAPFVLTSEAEGHAHSIRLYGAGGETSYSMAEDAEAGHSHPWAWQDGRVTIGASGGHTHEVQSGQLMAVLIAMQKRAFSAEERERLAKEGLALGDGSYPIVTRADLRNAIASFGRAANKGPVARHIKKRAAALEADDLLPDEGPLAKSTTTTTPKAGKEPTMSKSIEERLAALEKANETLNAQNQLQAIALGIAPEHREAFESMDANGKAEFAKADDSKRVAIVAELRKRKQDADPVVYTTRSGQPLRKSLGDHVITLAREKDDLAAQVEVLQKAGADAELRKRAETDLRFLPGSEAVKIAVLRKIDEIADEETRKAALDALKAQNARLGRAFEERGTAGGGAGLADEPGSALAKLSTLAKARAGERKISYEEAYESVAQENPDLAREAVIPIGGRVH